MTGVPDRFEGRSVVIDAKAAFEITPTTSSDGTNTRTGYMFIPTGPTCFWKVVYTGGVMKTATFTPVDIAQWGNAFAVSGFGSADKRAFAAQHLQAARCVSAGMRVRYTGPLTDTSGALIGWKFKPRMTKVPTITVTNSSANPPIATVANIMNYWVNGIPWPDSNYAASDPALRMSAATDGLVMVATNQQSEYLFEDTGTGWQMEYDPESADTTIDMPSYNIGSTVDVGSVWQDNAFEGLICWLPPVTKTTSSARYMLEFAVCAEGIPFPRSFLAATAHPSAPHDPIALEQAAKLGKMNATPFSFSEYADWLVGEGVTAYRNGVATMNSVSSALSGITNVFGRLSGLGGPLAIGYR